MWPLDRRTQRTTGSLSQTELQEKCLILGTTSVVLVRPVHVVVLGNPQLMIGKGVL